MGFREQWFYIPLAPADSGDPKAPNTKEDWPGPTVKTWGPEGEGCYSWEDRRRINWNRWGIVDIKGDKRLLILDFDLYKMEDAVKEEITKANFPATRVHKSSRGGQHVFYLLNPKNLNDGKLPVKLRKHIDDKLNGYVVDPECEGYSVVNDVEPAEIDPKTDLPEEWVKSERKSVESADKPEDFDEEDLQERLKTALDKDQKLAKLWEGDYESAGYDDRSSAEAALASKLGFWFGRDRSLIEKLMDKSAADKWHKRTDRPYRDSILETAMQGDEVYTPKDAGSEPIILEEPDKGNPADSVGSFYTYEGDRPFKGRLQISAEGKPRARFGKLRFICGQRFTETETHDQQDCSGCPISRPRHIDRGDESFVPSAFAIYFDTDKPKHAFNHLVKNGFTPKCPAWRKALVVEGEDQRATTPCKVVDREAREGRAWFIHGEECDLSKTPNWIEAEGWLCQGKQGRIGAIVKAFEPESSIRTPPVKKVDKARNVLAENVNNSVTELESSGLYKTARALKRKSNLKGDELIKGFASDLLVHASPTWVKTPEGPRQLGATAIELGMTTSAKSVRTRFLLDFLGVGDYETGKKTEAGLTAGAEKVESIGWVIARGVLPSADLTTVVLDNIPPQILEQQAEARRDGMVRVSAIKNARLWARCRMKIINNPPNPFDEYLYKCLALEGWDRKMIARFAFATLTRGVSTEDRYREREDEAEDGDGDLLDAVQTVIRWNLSKETTYKPDKKVWSEILNRGEELEEKFGNGRIPLLLRANPYKLSLLSYSFALLEGAEEPNIRHVELAHKWLEKCAEELELGEFTEYYRKEHSLTEEEYLEGEKRIKEEIEKEVEEHGTPPEESGMWGIILYLGKHGQGQRDEIAGTAEVSSKTISRRAKTLKGLRFLRSGKNGYRFTAKGVRFFKRLMKEGGIDALDINEKEMTAKEIDKKILDYYREYGDPHWTVARFLNQLAEHFGDMDREDLRPYVNRLKKMGDITLKDESTVTEDLGEGGSHA